MKWNLLLLLVSVLSSSETQTNITVQEPESGRYVFKQFGQFRSDVFMIDTKTGRLWRLVLAGETGKQYDALQAIPYITNSGNNVMSESSLSDELDRMNNKRKAQHLEKDFHSSSVTASLAASIVGVDTRQPSWQKGEKPAPPPTKESTTETPAK
jgi:hypothetical protein